MDCYCDQPKPFAKCCEPLLLGEQTALDPASLMRSRYSAFATHNADYILNSWHPKHKPNQLDLDKDQKWIGLKVVDSGHDKDSGWVKFVAKYKVSGKAHRLEEHSLFSRINGRWYYLHAVV